MESSVYRQYDDIFIDDVAVSDLVERLEFDSSLESSKDGTVTLTLKAPTPMTSLMRTHLSYHKISCTGIALRNTCSLVLNVEDEVWCGSNPMLLDPVSVLRFRLVGEPEFKEDTDVV